MTEPQLSARSGETALRHFRVRLLFQTSSLSVSTAGDNLSQHLQKRMVAFAPEGLHQHSIVCLGMQVEFDKQSIAFSRQPKPLNSSVIGGGEAPYEASLDKILQGRRDTRFFPPAGPSKIGLGQARIFMDQRQHSIAPRLQVGVSNPLREGAERCLLCKAEVEAKCVLQSAQSDNFAVHGCFYAGGRGSRSV